MHQSGAQRRPHPTAPPLPQLPTQASTDNTSAWPCCVCSANLDSGYGCGNQRWSSRTSCGCSSCGRSTCGSSSCCGWRCCSKRRRWWSGCWRKDWGGSKGWVAFWHCGERTQCVHLMLWSCINSTCRTTQQDWEKAPGRVFSGESRPAEVYLVIRRASRWLGESLLLFFRGE